MQNRLQLGWEAIFIKRQSIGTDMLLQIALKDPKSLKLTGPKAQMAQCARNTYAFLSHNGYSRRDVDEHLGASQIKQRNDLSRTIPVARVGCKLEPF